VDRRRSSEGGREEEYRDRERHGRSRGQSGGSVERERRTSKSSEEEANVEGRGR
jgi:hypothetical protein